MLKDLTTFILQQQENGDSIILGLDANMEIRGREFTQFLSDTNLINAIFQCHGKECPPTQIDNTKGKIIDGIFCTTNFSIRQAGYKALNNPFPSDHLALWIDVDIKEILGIHPIPLSQN